MHVSRGLRPRARKTQGAPVFCSDDEANRGYGGQGFHTLREANVDFDGRDEILYGHMCGDHDGKENLRGQTLRASFVGVGTDPSWSAGGVWG